ncbi:glutathione S-transferase [uncultured Neptuniibacter sp.]|uniref:glutathione S-transferase n=1 Tax=uncultured Neptuniibacter sp. TaxID=502143 RepID=UPI00262FA633|nr:glutathione S-transferase [uncultured Neptuniibacter sp.]
MTDHYPVLYTFRRCPYAIRARLALAYSRQTLIWREVVLKDKPAAMLEISPKATVPVLQLPQGEVIDESFDIMQWALQQSDPDNWLDQTNRPEIIALIAENDLEFKPHLDKYKYADRFPEESMTTYRARAELFLTSLEQRLEQHPFLLGDKITLADAAIVPFIRQFAGVDAQWFQHAPYPCLRRWLEAWLNNELFLSVMKKYPQWKEGDRPLLFPTDID